MYCGKCGAKIEKHDMFCPACGAQTKIGEDNDKRVQMVVRLQNGDNQAFNEIYMDAQQYVRFIVKMVITDDELAEDAVQSTFLYVYQNIGKLREPEKFNGWIKAIAYNTALQTAKKESKYVLENYRDEYSDLYFENAEETDTVLLPEKALESEEFKGLIEGFLNELPPQQKIALESYYYEGKQIKEISEELEISENTIKSSLRRGKEAFAKKVNEYTKKTGDKLYAAPILPIIYLIFREELTEVYAASSVPVAIAEISGTVESASSIGSSAGSISQTIASEGTVTAGVSAAEGAVSGATAAAGATATTLGVTAKIVIGVAAVAAVSAGGVVAYQSTHTPVISEETSVIQVDVTKDIVISLEGTNGEGRITLSETEAWVQDALTALGYDDTDAEDSDMEKDKNMLIDAVTITADQYEGLSNGDVVSIEVQLDEDALETYSDRLELVATEKSVKVEGLEEKIEEEVIAESEEPEEEENVLSQLSETFVYFQYMTTVELNINSDGTFTASTENENYEYQSQKGDGFDSTTILSEMGGRLSEPHKLYDNIYSVTIEEIDYAHEDPYIEDRVQYLTIDSEMFQLNDELIIAIPGARYSDYLDCAEDSLLGTIASEGIEGNEYFFNGLYLIYMPKLSRELSATTEEFFLNRGYSSGDTEDYSGVGLSFVWGCNVSIFEKTSETPRSSLNFMFYWKDEYQRVFKLTDTGDTGDYNLEFSFNEDYSSVTLTVTSLSGQDLTRYGGSSDGVLTKTFYGDENFNYYVFTS